MIHVTVSELEELKESIATLEGILATLDLIGAGIAAIHVDAAINQLQNNLEFIEEDAGIPSSLTPACQSEHPPYLP